MNNTKNKQTPKKLARKNETTAKNGGGGQILKNKEFLHNLDTKFKQPFPIRSKFKRNY